MKLSEIVKQIKIKLGFMLCLNRANSLVSVFFLKLGIKEMKLCHGAFIRHIAVDTNLKNENCTVGHLCT